MDTRAAMRDQELASEKPLQFEQMWQNGGFVLYHTQLKENKTATLNIPKLKDRAHVYLDNVRNSKVFYYVKNCTI